MYQIVHTQYIYRYITDFDMDLGVDLELDNIKSSFILDKIETGMIIMNQKSGGNNLSILW